MRKGEEVQEIVSRSVESDSLRPHDCSLPGSSVHGVLQARILEWVTVSFLGIFPTQGSNLGLLHCRQILYHLAAREEQPGVSFLY